MSNRRGRKSWALCARGQRFTGILYKSGGEGPVLSAHVARERGIGASRL
jgi:hypothetical protein